MFPPVVTTQTLGALIPSVTSETVSVTKSPEYFNIIGELIHVNTFILHKLAYFGRKLRYPIAQKEQRNFKHIGYTKTDKAAPMPKVVKVIKKTSKPETEGSGMTGI